MPRTFGGAGAAQIIEATSTPITTAPVSFSAWVRPTATGCLIAIGATGGGNLITLLLDGSLRPTLEVVATADIQANQGGSGITSGAWAHVGAVYASVTSMRTYLNGVAGTLVTTATGTPTGLNHISVGGQYSWGGFGSYLTGDLGLVSAWSAALTADDMAMLSRGVDPRLIQPASLVLDLPMNGDASPEQDRRGGRSFVLTNAPAKAATSPKVTRWSSRGALLVPSSSTGATITAVVADGIGTIPAPAPAASSVVTTPPADATGAIPIPAASAGANVTTPAVDGTGDVVAPGVSSGTISSPVGPSVISTTNQETANYAVAEQGQRSTFSAYGREWAFFVDDPFAGGADTYFVTSTDDGATWGSPVSTGFGGDPRAYDVHFDGTYVHIFVANAANLEYTRGLPDTSGSITWDTTQTVHAAPTNTYEVSGGTDSDGYPWVSWENWNGGTASVMVSGSSTKNGTWTARAGHPFTLSDGSTAPFVSLCWTYLGRLNNSGAMIALFWFGANVYARKWNGSSWGAYEGPIDSPSHDSGQEDIAFVTDPDSGTAYAAWGADTSGGWVAVRNAGTGVWTQEQLTTDVVNAVALGIDGAGTVHAFYVVAGAADKVHYQQRAGGSWSDQGDVVDVSAGGEELIWMSLQVSERARRGRLNVIFQTREPSDTLALDRIYSYVTPATSVTEPTPGANATVNAPPVDGAGDVPSPAVSAGAAVTSPPVDATGDVPDPSVSAGSTVTSPPADGTGTLPPTNAIVSADVGTGPLIGTGALIAPVVSGASAGQVIAPPAVGAGDVPPPGVAAGSATTIPPLTGAGDVPAPTFSGGGTPGATPPADGVGDVPSPGASAGADQTAPPADGTGDVPAPSTSASADATVSAPPLDGSGDVRSPSILSGKILPRIDLPTIVIIDPRITTVRLVDDGSTVTVSDPTPTVSMADPAPIVTLDPQLDSVILDGQLTEVLVDA